MIDFESLPLVSSPKILRTLLAKDWRLYRVPVLGFIVVSLACYVLGIVGTIYRWSELGGPRDSFFSAAVIAANISALLASVFGGVAVAGERGDRTADFMAMLPVARRQIICSKWLVSFFVVLTVGTINGIVALLMQMPDRRYAPLERAANDAGAVALWAGCMTCFFGTAWLLSTSIKSAAISACISMGTTASLAAFISICAGIGPHPDWAVQCTTAVTLEIVGLSSLVAGTLYYMRRIAP
jgi:ABC-type transport system involved in multi-copper enzyme maturation permease subunit